MTPKKNTTQNLPFPEIVNPRPWEIVGVPSPLLSGTSIKQGQIRVPLGNSDKDRFIRNHEMGHARWSPAFIPTVDGASPEMIQAVENTRINQLLEKAGIDTSPRVFSDEETALMGDNIKSQSLTERVIAALSFFSSGDEEPMGKAILGEDVYSSIRRFIRSQYGKVKSFQDFTVANSIFLQHLLGELEKKDDDSQPRPNKKLSDSEDDEQKEAGTKSSLDLTLFHSSRWAYEAIGRWGEMYISKVSLDKVIPPKLRAPSHVASDVGCYPNRIYRYCTDQRIFSLKRIRRIEAGTILVDVSGSMELSDHDILNILIQSPAATVALYSGGIYRKENGVTYESRSHGALVVVAEKGRRAKNTKEIKDEYLGKLNVVDGPALDWLGKQLGPRFWISDGDVTGPGDSQSGWHTMEAARKCHQHSIRRFDELDDLLDHLKERSRL